ncbi:FAM120B [Cervus elaphus hippelaphus]|uniref:Constitutive coactivator of peroxisome proliferator-activated receptor gamma n=1 Tax=Cervus elaphus hippelaphus TaxID=46360 RepID=A0A212C7H0_CEREH|nr:FAM120B [Cervus elaphus hippelaphus]
MTLRPQLLVTQDFGTELDVSRRRRPPGPPLRPPPRSACAPRGSFLNSPALTPSLQILPRSSIMGVRGLHGFVASSCPHVCTVVNFKELAERHRSQHPGGTPTVVVDAMCCLRYWYTPESWICGGQWREYYSSLREFVRTFTAVGIKLIFFFDGMVEQSKRDEWVKRRLKNNREIAKIFHYIKSHREQPGRNMFFIPSGLAIFTRFALKALGQETLCSLQEADYEVASYGFQNNCLGILGEDTDYLIYDTCPYFSISELSLDSLDTVMLCREKLCQSLGLSLADLPLLACLLGNDVVPEGMFESFRYKCLTSYTSVKENCDRRGNIILAVADHISKVLRLHQGEKKLEEMLPLGPNKALFYKGVTSYLLPGQKSPWFIQKPKDVVTLDKQILSMSSDPESKQEVPMCMDPESKQKLPVGTDPEFNLEAPMCTNTEVKHEDPVNTGPEAKHQVTMVTDPEILKPYLPLSWTALRPLRWSVPAGLCRHTPREAAHPVPRNVLSGSGLSFQTGRFCEGLALSVFVAPSSWPALPRLRECPLPLREKNVSEHSGKVGGGPARGGPDKQWAPRTQRTPMPHLQHHSRLASVLLWFLPVPRSHFRLCASHLSLLGSASRTLTAFPVLAPYPLGIHCVHGQPGVSPSFLQGKSRKVRSSHRGQACAEESGSWPECSDRASVSRKTVSLGRNQLHLTVGQVARAQHVQAESYLVYGVMSSGEVECSNSLEDATDQALPSQAFVYRPVRQRVYSLLLGGGAGESWSPGAVRLELILRTGQME